MPQENSTTVKEKCQADDGHDPKAEKIALNDADVGNPSQNDTDVGNPSQNDTVRNPSQNDADVGNPSQNETDVGNPSQNDADVGNPSQNNADVGNLLQNDTDVNNPCVKPAAWTPGDPLKNSFLNSAFLDTEQVFTVGGVLLRHVQQLVCNAHAITALHTTQVDQQSAVETHSQVRVATAIYPTASLMNHSCDPTIISR
jgi:hypothetical protein